MLFSYENPPGTKEVAGSQDAIGIVFPGLNYLYYDGQYWPERITSIHDESVLSWVEDRLWLVPLGPRESHFSVLDDTRITAEGAARLAEAADACHTAILARDTEAFGAAVRASFEAQIAMFPLMANEEIMTQIADYQHQVLGWKLSGAGGGGYLVLVSETPVTPALNIKIRRNTSL